MSVVYVLCSSSSLVFSSIDVDILRFGECEVVDSESVDVFMEWSDDVAYDDACNGVSVGVCITVLFDVSGVE